MLRIPCPWCGLRDQTEFHCGGEANRHRPDEPWSSSDDEWANYLYMRDNTKGVHLERWVHAWGCRQWFLVERDTATHEITRSLKLDSAGSEPGV
jgi:heterotetrameric sarcosine oxidase delta subunit